MIKIKVCGITNLADAEKALEFGADALGFNFYPPSARCITPKKARKILEELPERCCNVALFVNEPKEKVREIVACREIAGGRQAFSGLQFHGEEGADCCPGWPMKVIRTVRLKRNKSCEGLKDL